MELPVHAQTVETNAATISAGLVRGIPGSTANLPLSLSHTGIVAAVQYDLTFNPARMTAGTLLGGVVSNAVLRSRQVAPGQYRVLLYHTGPALLASNTPLGSLPFTVPVGQLSGGGRVTITNAVVASPGASLVSPVRLRHGNVLVGPVYRGSDGIVELFLTAQSDRLYVVQATTNFVNWVNIATNFAALDYIVAQDLEAVNYPARFYRAVPVESGGGQITALNLEVGNRMTFGYASAAGRTYVLQTSTNLTGWDNLTTNVAGGSLLNFTNLISPIVPSQFFRVLEVP